MSPARKGNERTRPGEPVGSLVLWDALADLPRSTHPHAHRPRTGHTPATRTLRVQEASSGTVHTSSIVGGDHSWDLSIPPTPKTAKPLPLPAPAPGTYAQASPRRRPEKGMDHGIPQARDIGLEGLGDRPGFRQRHLAVLVQGPRERVGPFHRRGARWPDITAPDVGVLGDDRARRQVGYPSGDSPLRHSPLCRYRRRKRRSAGASSAAPVDAITSPITNW